MPLVVWPAITVAGMRVASGHGPEGVVRMQIASRE
jgi:hypothetical protein